MTTTGAVAAGTESVGNCRHHDGTGEFAVVGEEGVFASLLAARRAALESPAAAELVLALVPVLAALV